MGVTTLNNLVVSSLYFGVTYFIIHSACKYNTAESLKLGSTVAGSLFILMSTFFVIDIRIRKESMEKVRSEVPEKLMHPRIDSNVYNSVRDFSCLHAILTLGLAPATGYLEHCVVEEFKKCSCKN